MGSALWEVGRENRARGRKEEGGCRTAFRKVVALSARLVGAHEPIRMPRPGSGWRPHTYSKVRRQMKETVGRLFSPRRPSSLERLNDHQDDDADHQQGQRLVGQPVKALLARVVVCRKVLAPIAQRVVIAGQ